MSTGLAAVGQAAQVAEAAGWEAGVSGWVGAEDKERAGVDWAAVEDEEWAFREDKAVGVACCSFQAPRWRARASSGARARVATAVGAQEAGC